jgi:hypothetical protein
MQEEHMRRQGEAPGRKRRKEGKEKANKQN